MSLKSRRLHLNVINSSFSGIAWSILSWGVCIFFLYFLFQFQPADDPYITYRYARNLNQGYGLVFNPGGERVEGYTNFAWMLISAFVMKVGLHPLIATKILGAILALITLILVQRITVRLLSPAPPWNSLSIAFIGSMIPFAVWVTSGLETALTTLLITVAIYLRLREQGNRLALGYSIVSILLLLDRPDTVVAIAALFGDLLLTWWQTGVRDRRELAQQLALFIGPILLVMSPYYLWHVSYFGYFFPNTFYAKGGEYPLLFKMGRGIVYILEFIGAWAAVATFLAALYFIRGISSGGPRLCYMLIILHIAYVLYTGGDVLPYSRFFVSIIPALSILCVLSLNYLVNQVSPRGILTTGIPLIAISVTLMTSVYAWNAQRLRQVGSLSISAKISALSEPICPVCNWFKAYAPANSSVALFAAGYVPYYTNFRTIDRIGLNDTFIAHNGQPVLSSGNVQPKISLSYWLPQQPTFIFTRLNNDELLKGRIKSEYIEDELLFKESLFLQNYVLLILQPEDSPTLQPYTDGIFQRIDSVDSHCLEHTDKLPIPYCVVNVDNYQNLAPIARK